MLQRIARIMYRHRLLVLTGWILLLGSLVVINSIAGGEFLDEFSLPGSESQKALDLLESRGFEKRAGYGGQLVFRADSNINDLQIQRTMEDLFAEFEADIPNTEVVSPSTAEGSRQVSQLDPIAYAQVNLGDRNSQEYQEAAKTARGLVEELNLPGLQVELGGDIFMDQPQFGSEAIGFIAAMLILLIAFGSVLAMGLPLLTALFGIVTGVSLVGLAVNIVNMPSFSTQSVLMIGIGVGIDYALFIVTRYREGLHVGMSPEVATVRAIDTAGRAVLFAGTIVIIAVLGLTLMGMEMMRGLAIGMALGVLMTMLAALTLLPAMLGFIGRRIDRLGLPHRRRRDAGQQQTLWYRWSRIIQRRPWPALVVGLAALIFLSIPLFSLRLGFGDAGNRPTGDTTRQAYDLLSEGFGPGFNAPLVLVMETPGGADDEVLARLSRAVAEMPEVAYITPPIPNQAGDTAILQVFPVAPPQDEGTNELVNQLRGDVIPDVTRGSGVSVYVGGVTAGALDFSDFAAGRLPLFMGAVLLLSFLLLMAVFRSILVPLKAVIMNLISIGAAFGVLVAVFQWGHGAELIGVGKEGPVEAWAPMMLFALLFGLSMDYEVFLLSRIREDYDHSHDNSVAVANGLAVTGRVITAAALIMVCVFGSFVLGTDRSLKLFGLGLAAAVLLDATIVRVVVVPATMELLGERNWWLPKRLDRLLPAIHVEATED